MDGTTDNTTGTLYGKLTFLGESPAAWFIFIVMISLMLWVWGGIIRYLSGDT